MMNLMAKIKYLLVTTLLLNYCLKSGAERFDVYRSNDVVSLCEDPVIYTADRLLNNTVRLYRGDHYWELRGIPGTKGFLDGPHRVWYPGFKTVYPNTTLVTFLSGYRTGWLTRFEGQRWYAWQADGYQGWGDHGTTSHSIPKGGFSAVFHNGNKTDPMLIGLEGIKVHYYTTKTDIYNQGMRYVGNVGGYIGGQFGENFPPDVTSAFSYPSTDSETDGYFVYLFRNEKYCFRAAYRQDATQPCDEWRLNKELFGCDGDETESQSPPVIVTEPIEILTTNKVIIPTEEIITDLPTVEEIITDGETEAKTEKIIPAITDAVTEAEYAVNTEEIPAESANKKSNCSKARVNELIIYALIVLIAFVSF